MKLKSLVSAVETFVQAASRSVLAFSQEEDGQDLIEYSLLMAFFALTAVGLVSDTKVETSEIWATLNGALSRATGAAS